jgi:hypothetical protein
MPRRPHRQPVLTRLAQKRKMGIWATQAIHDAVTRVLALHPEAAAASHAFVDVSTLGEGTKAALMRNGPAGWVIDALYTADHYTPGTVGVVVRGLW